jgi:hypothetical protein
MTETSSIITPNNIDSTNLSQIDISLIEFHFNGWYSSLNFNLPFVLILIVVPIIIVLCSQLKWPIGLSKKVEVTLRDPFSGSSIKIVSDYQEKKIAHKMWTQLITRKAAIPFERDNDVITEVYDSWYSLFGEIRQLISDIPVEKLRGRKKTDIESLIRLSTQLLNDCMRPHLTQWQAGFRRWYEAEEQNQPLASPQEIQRNFFLYEELTKDMESVNKKLCALADELKRLVEA